MLDWTAYLTDRGSDGIGKASKLQSLKAQIDADMAATKAWLDDAAEERPDADCAKMGPVGIG
ncbi:hypothetical protein [Pseudomonas phoenicis]|uniref:hypothetical protein n=1 Tax=unclassified Pseudomonas TaxID=196821 RepID=UPI0039A365B6